MSFRHNQQTPYTNQGYLPNGAPPSGPAPGPTPITADQGRVIQQGSVRLLCVADVRGNLRSLNELARSTRADYIIHTGDFGFYDDQSLDRIAEKTFRHVAQYSPLLSESVKRQIQQSPPQSPARDRFPKDQLPLSELPYFLNGTFKLDVPVYTVWGACEDVRVLEKLRASEYKVPNLHIIDEAHSQLLEVGGVKIRLLGLGGAVVMHKLFDNGEGKTTIAGGQGTMWTTLLQMGELVDTANRVYDPTETRILITHASPAREGLLNQLSVTLKADFSISAGLHFRYGSSYNEFSVNPSMDHYRGKLAASKASFNDVWETVRSEVEPAVAENESQQKLLNNALDIVAKMPSTAGSGHPFGGNGTNAASGQIDESAFKNMWNFNLADAAYGYLVLEVDNGRIGTEMRAQGFNFAHRSTKPVPGQVTQSGTVDPSTTTATSQTSTQAPLPYNQSAPAAADSRQPARTPNQPLRSSSQSIHAQQPQTASTQQLPPQPKAIPAPSTKPAPPPINHTPTQAVKDAIQPAPPSTTPKPAIDVITGANTIAATEANLNGAPAPSGKPVDNTAAVSKTSPAPQPKEPSKGIFVMNLQNEEEVRAVFTPNDAAKITHVERQRNGNNFAAMFPTPEDMQGAMDRAREVIKEKNSPARLREYMDQRNRPARGGYNAGTWQPSNSRGGYSDARAGQMGQGYRSAGASDSEGGRGRGASFRGRGRGERGRGRGGRGGKPGEGNANTTTHAATTTTTTTTAVSATPAGGDA